MTQHFPLLRIPSKMAKECALVVEEDTFNDLYLTGVEFAGEVEGRELGRGSYGVVYEVMWRGTPCAAKKIHPILLESVPGGWVIRKLLFNPLCWGWAI